MHLNEWYYLLIAALINSIFTIFWQIKIGHKKVSGIRVLALIFIGSFLVAWGMDVLQRLVEVLSLAHMMQISLGCWLFIAVATSAKHYALSGWSQKKFWIDYGGDLVGFMLMGLLIFAFS